MRSKLWYNALLVSLFLLVSPVLSTAQDTTQAVSKAEAIPDTLLFKIQKAQSVIGEIKAVNKKRLGIDRIRAGLSDVKANVDPVAADVLGNEKTIDAKSLSNYGLILNDALGKLTDWRTVLTKSNNDLQNTLDQVLNLSTDSLLTVAGNDTTEKKLYADQLGSLKVQLQDAGTRTSAQLDSVSRLLADVSGTYLKISNLQTNINERLQKSKESAFQRESPYLWNTPVALNTDQLGHAFSSSFQGQDQILRYFFTSNWDNRFLLLLLAGLFFVWVYTNLKKANDPELGQKLGTLNVDTLKPVPIVASLFVLLNLTPLFEPYSPSLYVEITQFLLLVILTSQLWKRFSKHDKWMWLLTATLFIVLIVINATVSASFFMRFALMVLNVGFLYVGFVFFNQFPHRHISKRILGPVSKLCLVLQVLAILLNIFGRITLAKTFTITAVVGLIQLTSLGVFIEIMLEALELQIRISACSEGIFSRVNVSHTRGSFKKGLAFVAIALWLLVFFINLGAADNLFDLAYQFLSKPRSFGSITFTLSNVLSFSVIIYLSSLLQRNIGLLFGESQLPNADDNESVGQISSVLALVRLVIIIAGILLAIAASGVSIDKFTVVLGALSVGIGLGMQNIVSNFVSGIILIFEKPFQIGDYVELADKKGRIQTIGIRSSKMVTIQGSEVIIPNSDLLSNRLVNWTSGDTYLKTELTLKLSADTDLQALRQTITTEVSKLEAAIVNKAPEILVTAISGDSIEVKVLVFMRSVYAEAGIKSQLLQHLLTKFREENIKIM